jgi:hypothetical protein
MVQHSSHEDSLHGGALEWHALLSKLVEVCNDASSALGLAKMEGLPSIAILPVEPLPLQHSCKPGDEGEAPIGSPLIPILYCAGCESGEGTGVSQWVLNPLQVRHGCIDRPIASDGIMYNRKSPLLHPVMILALTGCGRIGGSSNNGERKEGMSTLL